MKTEIGDLKKLITSICSSLYVVPPTVASVNRSSFSLSASVPVSKNYSYASIVKFNDVVVIKPKNSYRKCDATKLVLQMKIKAADFNARGISNGSNGGIIVQYKTKECSQKFMAKSLARESWDSAEAKSSCPSLRVFGENDC